MIDKEAFLKPSVAEEVVTLPGKGDVLVRGLTRLEAVSLQKVKDDPAALECLIVRLGLVQPSLTEEEVKAWYASDVAGHTDLIVSAVERLSGLSEGAPKSDVPGPGKRPRA